MKFYHRSLLVYSVGTSFRVLLPEFRRQAQNSSSGGGLEDGQGGVGEVTRGAGTIGNEADQGTGRTGKDQETTG